MKRLSICLACAPPTAESVIVGVVIGHQVTVAGSFDWAALNANKNG
jgi:hypothetical protein